MKLNKGQKDELRSLARELVKGDPALVKASEAARGKAAKLVLEGMAKKFPPADMEVLARYKMTESDDCIRVKHSDELSSFDQFEFDEGTGPVVPNNGSCRPWNRPVYYFGDKTGQAVIDANKAKDALNADIDQRLQAYDQVIEAATNVEMLLKVWPEAKTVTDRFVKNLPARITDQAAALIADDMAQRAKA